MAKAPAKKVAKTPAKKVAKKSAAKKPAAKAKKSPVKKVAKKVAKKATPKKAAKKTPAKKKPAAKKAKTPVKKKVKKAVKPKPKKVKKPKKAKKPVPKKPKKPKRKKGQKKDKDAPKRAMSAFFLFAQDERPKVKAANPSASIGDIGKELGARWAKCPAAAKAGYEKKAGALKVNNKLKWPSTRQPRLRPLDQNVLCPHFSCSLGMNDQRLLLPAHQQVLEKLEKS